MSDNKTTRLPRICTRCGRSIQVGFIVCDHCGAQQERHASAETDGLSGIELRWEGDFLFLGKISVGFVGYDLRREPTHFTAYVGREDNIVGWFQTREDARREVVRYIKEGRPVHVPF